MTKREYDTFKESACPCGKGQVTRHVDSTDYRYSSVHISYSLDCSECRKEWRLENRSLINIESERYYVTTEKISSHIRGELYDLARTIVKQHFMGLSFKTRKAELEYLHKHDLCNESYTSYTKLRRNGQEIFEIVYGLRNIAWLRNISIHYNYDLDLENLILEDSRARAETDSAALKVVRWKSK
jgi:hypothetical protein